MTTLTVDQHKQAVKLGIAQREDGLWGFKKKCVNEKCDKIFQSYCYASDTFEESVQEVSSRSAYSCSNECWAESGELWPWISEYYSDEDLAESGECTEETVARLKRRIKNGTTRNLPLPDQKILSAWIQDLVENYGGDGDIDEYEVGCEI